MIINCIIIDDEPLARKGLKEYIADVDFLNLAGEFDNALKAMETINSGTVQLIFLDIQMPRISGLDFIKTFNVHIPVIFTTAYQAHALEGYELNAVDYLLKPVSFERFLKAVLKVKEYYTVREKNLTDTGSEGSYFFIKADNKLVKIVYADILFIEGLQNYICIHTKTKKYITYLTFKAVEEYLPASQFIKVHKSYIIAADKTDSIEGNELLISGHKVPISRALKNEIMDKLLKGKFLRR